MGKVQFIQHEDFQRDALGMAFAGGVSAIAAHVASLLSPVIGSLQGPISLSFITAGAISGLSSIGSLKPVYKMGALLFAIVFSAVSLWFFVGSEPTLGALLFAGFFAIFFARGMKESRFWVTLFVAAAMLFVARFVLDRFVSSSLVTLLPTWSTALISGASFGLVASLGLLPRHLGPNPERIRPLYESLKGKSSGELAALQDRAMSLWEKVETSEKSPVRDTIEASIIRFLEVAQRLQQAEPEKSLSSADSLVAQMTSLEEKRDKATDEEAKQQYELARGAIGEQLKYVREIGASRERVIARLHNYLAAIEKTRLALVNNQTASVAEDSASIRNMLGELEELGNTFDTSSDALLTIEKSARA